MRTERPIFITSMSPLAMASSTVRRQVANCREASCLVNSAELAALAAVASDLVSGRVCACIDTTKSAQNRTQSRISVSANVPGHLRNALKINNIRENKIPRLYRPIRVAGDVKR